MRVVHIFGLGCGPGWEVHRWGQPRTKQMTPPTKPNGPIGDKRLKPTRAQTTAVDQTTEFDHVGHNELHFSNLLPKLRGPDSSAGVIATPTPGLQGGGAPAHRAA